MRKSVMCFMLVASVACSGVLQAQKSPSRHQRAKVSFPHPEVNFYAVTPNPDLSITVMRSGNLGKACAVRFRCLDGSALQGTHFVPPQNDTIIFAPGEAFATSDAFIFKSGAIGKQFYIELRKPTKTSIGQYKAVVATIREDV